MPRIKKTPEPLSLDLSPLNKKNPGEKSERKKIGLISHSKNRKMISLRMRVQMINTMDDLIRKLKKKTKTKYSQSALIEMAISLASKATIEDLLSSYGESFKY